MKNKSTTIFSIILALVMGLYEIAHGSIVANDLADPYPGGNKMIEANVTDGAAFFFRAQINISALFLEGENGSKDKLNFVNSITNIDAVKPVVLYRPFRELWGGWSGRQTALKY